MYIIISEFLMYTMVIGILNSTLSNDKKKKWSSEPTIKNETEPKSLMSRKNSLILKIMKKTFFKTGLVLLVALLSISCSKDGETGPAGPAGANGINGTNGINGNANVLSSTVFTTTASNWTTDTGGIVWTATLTGATEITQNIVDRGIVSVFILTGSQWSPLPFTFFNQNMSYSFGVGTIEFVAYGTDYAVIPNPSNVTMRFVVISPSNRLSHPNTDWNDYNQVKEALHLKD